MGADLWVRKKEPWEYLEESTAAAAKSFQSCPTLCDPIDSSPPGSPVPGTLQARTLEWVAISFSNAWKGKVKVKSPSRIRLLAIPWTVAHQAPPSMGFSRQEYWSGVPLPSPEESTRAGKTAGGRALRQEGLAHPRRGPGPIWLERNGQTSEATQLPGQLSRTHSFPCREAGLPPDAQMRALHPVAPFASRK